MSAESTPQYDSLSWVKEQLDAVLDDAQKSLSEYIENTDNTENLQACADHLRLVCGTLQMVEIYGASMLAEEMQKTAQAQLDGTTEVSDDVFDVLMRAILQLPDYLEGLQAGNVDSPIKLLPLMNDLRAARKDSLLSEVMLFLPDIESEDIEGIKISEGVVAGQLHAEAKKLRRHYQLGLLDFIKNKKQMAGLKRMYAVVSSLEKASYNISAKKFWVVITAFLESIIDKSIGMNASVKKILAIIDRQIKHLVDTDEETFSEGIPKELFKNILYYIGRSKSKKPRSLLVKKAYKLDDLLPDEESEDGSSSGLGGLNTELFITVSEGIKDDLTKVKDALEIFIHGTDKDVTTLQPQVEQLEKIADTYGMLGLGVSRNKTMEQSKVLAEVVEGKQEIDDELVMTIADELLAAETELNDYIAKRSGFSGASTVSDTETSIPAAEYREVLSTVVSQGLGNFTFAKENILTYIAGNGDREQLEDTINRLEEVRGITLMLSMERIEAQVKELMNYVQSALINNNHKPDEQEQEAVADVVTCIEYFLESKVEGRLGVEAGLEAGDKAAAYLADACKDYEGVVADEVTQAQDVQGETEEVGEKVSTETEEEPVAEVAVETKPESSPVSEVPDAVAESAPVVEQPPHEEFIILSDDADEEILEIFIEEAIEVLETLNESYPQWKANSENEEALTVVRRSFHTLKGSGRLIGAQLIGEFSWKFENMLNRVIDKQIHVSPTLFEAMDEALAVIPQLIEQLKGNREPISNIYTLMAAADTLAEGGTPVLGAAVEPAAEPAVEKTEETEKEAEPEAGEIQEAEKTAPEETATETSAVEVEETGSSLDEALNASQSDDDLMVSLSEADIDKVSLVPDSPDEDESDTEETGIEVSEAEDEISLEDFQVDDSDELVEQDAVEVSDEDDEDAISLVDIADDDDIADLGFEDEPDAETTDDLASVGDEEESATIDLSGEMDTLDDDMAFEEAVTIDEEQPEEESAPLTSMDPVLFGIYYDESKTHLQSVLDLLENHDSGSKPLAANKELIRAFHTLYGSARTAEIEEIAEINGATEKYLKEREIAPSTLIPDAVVEIIRDVTNKTIELLDGVKQGVAPIEQKELMDRIHKALKQELQEQLQRSAEEPNLSESEQVEEDTSDIDASTPEVVTEDIEPTEGAAKPTEEQPATTETTQTAAAAIQSEMPAYADIDEDLIDIFIEEAEELLENCDTTVNTLEAAPENKEAITVLQRDMHTLKGGARMAELKSIGDLTHALESLVIELENDNIKAEKQFFSVLHESMDTLNDMLSSVRSRSAIRYSTELVNNVEALTRGETIEQRSVERFDVELEQLDQIDEEEDIQISDVALADVEESINKTQAVEKDEKKFGRRESDAEDKPHWGERATDTNYRESQDQVRVRADLLNSLVNSAGEVNIFHARMGKQITDIGFNLHELDQTVIRLKEQLRNLEIETEIQIRSSYAKESDTFDDSFDPLEMDQYSTMQQLARSLSETASDVQSIKDILGEIVRDSETLLLQESRVSTELQEGLMRTRMVRFGGLSSRMRRIVRQTARELNKDVELEIMGETIEIDRKVLDNIVAPLEHMIRNAVAHGIEEPAVRLKHNKNETGKIMIRVDRTGSEIILTIKDDGAGMNVDAIREKAISKGLLDKDNNLSDQDVLQFILKAGFSTASNVTQIAGRGVGMDVVDSEIKQLGGLLEISTTKGEGSTFTITLPVTLAINQALLVSSNEDIYAVPLASIEGVVRVSGHELQSFYNDAENKFYEFNGIQYELKHLGNLLTGYQPDYSGQHQLFPVLLAKVGEHYFALHVDDLIERREIVVKPVGHQLGMVRGISGATILADGRVVLIIEMAALVVGETLFRSTEATATPTAPPVKEDHERVIMIVDDSITIRKVTTRMLERNGINVLAAKDGVDATDQLQENIPDLMLLDIEMPRMDGFELATYVRNDERLKDIPIIMITSRTGEKHKEKAFSIGVNQYLGKPYQEEELMKNINEILGD